MSLSRTPFAFVSVDVSQFYFRVAAGQFLVPGIADGVVLPSVLSMRSALDDWYLLVLSKHIAHVLAKCVPSVTHACGHLAYGVRKHILWWWIVLVICRIIRSISSVGGRTKGRFPTPRSHGSCLNREAGLRNHSTDPLLSCSFTEG